MIPIPFCYWNIGYRNIGSQLSAKAGCELCYVLLVANSQTISRPESTRFVEQNAVGKFVL